jgi:hypothetical protein
VCGCTPTTCAAENKNCGTISDGCGKTLDCGDCQGQQTCGGGGKANVCGGCTPLTDCPAGYDCGTIPDGCGGNVVCGGCNDNVACTDDSCNGSHKCVHDPNDAKCDDNDTCTVDMCTGTSCTHVSMCDPDAATP